MKYFSEGRNQCVFITSFPVRNITDKPCCFLFPFGEFSQRTGFVAIDFTSGKKHWQPLVGRKQEQGMKTQFRP